MSSTPINNSSAPVPSSSSSSTPTKKARWGLVSTARVNRHIIAAAHNSQVGEVTAVASRNAETASKYAEAQKIPKHFPTYNAMLTSDEIDCVYVSLPNNSHTDVVIRAAENKKHILCEKPMALTAADVSKMFDAAEKNQVVLMEGFMNLHSAVVHKARALLEEGAIGEVIGMNAIFTYTETRGGFRRTASIAEGGGSLYDVGAYEVALARFLVGREPTSCHCTQTKVPVPEQSDIAVSPVHSPSTVSSSSSPNSTTSAFVSNVKSISLSPSQVDETSAGTLFFSKREGDVRPSPLNGDITFQFLASFSSPLNMGFTILGTKGQMKIRNPFKPNPEQDEEIHLQHDIDEPPVVFKVKGVGLAEDRTGHLYQGELDVISRVALASKAEQELVACGKNPTSSSSSSSSSTSRHVKTLSDTGRLTSSSSAGMFATSSAMMMMIPGTTVLSRAFSVGNAACLEALHKSAENSTVEKIVIHP